MNQQKASFFILAFLTFAFLVAVLLVIARTNWLEGELVKMRDRVFELECENKTLKQEVQELKLQKLK